MASFRKKGGASLMLDRTVGGQITKRSQLAAPAVRHRWNHYYASRPGHVGIAPVDVELGKEALPALSH